MTKAEIEQANAAHDLEETRIVTAQDLEEMRVSSKDLKAAQFVNKVTAQAATRRRNILLQSVIIGILFTGALLAVHVYQQSHLPVAPSVSGHHP